MEILTPDDLKTKFKDPWISTLQKSHYHGR